MFFKKEKQVEKTEYEKVIDEAISEVQETRNDNTTDSIKNEIKELIKQLINETDKSKYDEILDRIERLVKVNKDILGQEDADIENLKKIIDMKDSVNEKKWWQKIDPNIPVQIGGTFIVVMAVLIFEKTDVVNTKAWNWVTNLIPRARN